MEIHFPGDGILFYFQVLLKRGGVGGHLVFRAEIDVHRADIIVLRQFPRVREASGAHGRRGKLADAADANAATQGYHNSILPSTKTIRVITNLNSFKHVW